MKGPWAQGPGKGGKGGYGGYSSSVFTAGAPGYGGAGGYGGGYGGDGYGGYGGYGAAGQSQSQRYGPYSAGGAAGASWQDGAGYMETEKDRLVRSIKDIQRSNPAGREQWERFADAAGMGTRDPGRHPEENLRAFIQALESGQAPETIVPQLGTKGFGKSKGPWSGGGHQAPSNAVPGSKEDLVAKVKQIQRSEPDGKTKWEEFCGILRTGNRDPARHTDQALNLFLESFARGAMPSEPIYGKVLRLRGVPFQSELHDVVAFLAEYSIDENSIVLGRGPDGKKTGEAYVVMPSVEIAEQALEAKQKQEIHGRYIELFRASLDDWDESKGYHETFLRNQGGAAVVDKEALVAEVKHIQRSSEDGRAKWERFCDTLRTANRDPLRHTSETLRAFIQGYKTGEDLDTVAVSLCKDSPIVRLRGVPFQAGIEDVLQFLTEYNIRESDVTFLKRSDGRHMGEAIVVFASVQLAQQAMELKQRQEIQGRYIELFRSSAGELEEAKTMTHPPRQTGKGGDPAAAGWAGTQGMPGWSPEWGAWGDAQAQAQMGQAQGYGAGKGQAAMNPMNAGAGYNWAAGGKGAWNAAAPPAAMLPALPAISASKEELVSQVKKIQRNHADGKTRWEEYCGVLRTGNRDPARHTEQALKMFLEAFEKGQIPTEPIYSNVLRLRGVPFQSELSDVLAFLAEYGIDEKSVCLGRGPDGKKTGEAYVVMPSVEIAEQALQVKQRQEIHGRYIELFRASLEDFDESKVHQEAFLRMHGGTADAINKEALVAEVKHIQRSSEDGRAKWERFCDVLRTANRDPLRHTPDTLRAFAQGFKTGEDLDTVAVNLGKDSPVVRMRGVPFQAGVEDILQFLSEYSIREHDVTFMKRPDGRHMGEAVVMFPNAHLAQRALDEKQRHEIQGRYIELFRSTHAELEEARTMTHPLGQRAAKEAAAAGWAGVPGYAPEWGAFGDAAGQGYGAAKGKGAMNAGYNWATSGKGLFGNSAGFRGAGPYGK